MPLRNSRNKCKRRWLIIVKSNKDQCIINSSISNLQKTLYESTPETSEHCNRIEQLALKFAQKIGLPNSDTERLLLFAPLHDIGKITIPKCILGKPERLNENEWEIMKSHSFTGYEITNSDPELKSISNLILSHHERWDGKGYPQRLKKQEIPFLSRIITVIDSYDAMLDNRPYKKPLSKAEAIKELKNNSGTQFDPDVVGDFIKILE